jgi:hypothetical protein
VTAFGSPVFDLSQRKPFVGSTFWCCPRSLEDFSLAVRLPHDRKSVTQASETGRQRAHISKNPST